MHFNKHQPFTILICISLILASCGSPAPKNDEIATAVAQTVQAQNSLTEVSAPPTLTPAPPPEPTSTPQAEPASPTPASPSNPGCVASALLIGENPPDGTLFKPGDYFYKTWTFQNTGTCIWDKSYTLNFWSGERMGGLTSYSIPEVVLPEGTINISIYLQAPTTEGSATGYWRFKTPWGVDFGVGPQSASFYVAVSVAAKPRYGITNVTYQLLRDPEKDCPINVRYIVVATVTSNGPVEMSYYWDQKDGNESAIKTYKFPEAGSATFKREWMISLNDSPNPRWIQFIVMGPEYHEYEKVIIDHDCFHQ